jgi:hypothetical protein
MRNHARLLACATLALGLAACSDQTGGLGGPQQPALTKAQADSLAGVVTADVDAMTQGAAVGTWDGGFTAGAGLIDMGDRLGWGCMPARSPATPANSDADPVPDSIRLDFSGCGTTTRRGTVAYSGTIDVLDPTPTDSDFAVKLVYTDFARTLTGSAGGTSAVKQNGSRLFLRSPSKLQQVEHDFHTDFTFPDGSTASHVKDWSATFTADVAGSIGRGRLPSGTWDITGTSTWTRGDRTYSLAVTTDPDLHYNASCEEAPRFDSGKITTVVTRAGTTSTVTVEFTACGQYTVTRS